MKFYITASFLFLTLMNTKANDLTYTVKNTSKGAQVGAVDVSVNGGTAPYSYKWAGPNGFSANTEDIDKLGVGTYTITVTDNYCGIATATIAVTDVPNSIAEINAEHIDIYPNPTTAVIDINLPVLLSNYRFRVLNALGEVMVDKADLSTSSLTVDLKTFNAGIYFIEISKQGNLVRKKVIKY